jgi:YD repeat-containing protein
VLFAVLGPAAAATETAGVEGRALFLVVLQPLERGQEPFDVTRHGGTLEAQHGARLAVMLPESAVEGVRRNPRVRYVQRAVLGHPARTASPPRTSPGVASHALRPLTPVTDSCTACTIGPYSYDGSGNITATGTANTFRYDGVGRLRSADVYDGSTTRKETYTYDIYGNLTSLVNDGVTIDLPVDAGTNRLSSTLGAVYDGTGNLTQSVGATYAYNQGGCSRA